MIDESVIFQILFYDEQFQWLRWKYGGFDGIQEDTTAQTTLGVA